jgi:hypothetical protein
MSAWEAAGQSDEWFTPKYIFDAMGVEFDTDVASTALMAIGERGVAALQTTSGHPLFAEVSV